MGASGWLGLDRHVGPGLGTNAFKQASYIHGFEVCTSLIMYYPTTELVAISQSLSRLNLGRPVFCLSKPSGVLLTGKG